MKTCGIYQIRCIVNDKKYIGSSKWIQNRWAEHKRLLSRNRHYAKHLQYAWSKYSSEQFKFETLEECKKEVLLEQEQYYLDKFKPFLLKNGYNTSPIAGKVGWSRYNKQRTAEYSNRWKRNNPNYLPGVCEARSIRINSGTQYCAFKDKQKQRLIQLNRLKPFILSSPEDMKFVFSSILELQKILGISFNRIRSQGQIKQGKNRGWRWKGYTQLYI